MNFSYPSPADYDYELPPESIAQQPPERRGDSRLLVLQRSSGNRQHRQFGELAALLRPGDVLVLNDSKVFPARLRIRRPSGARGELLLLEPLASGDQWNLIGRPARALQPGEVVEIVGSDVMAHPLRRDGKIVVAEFRDQRNRLTVDQVFALCERYGETPLPPYIRRSINDPRATDDRDRYQTVYARRLGSAAAPTAGLHFSDSLLTAIRARGVTLAALSLHVGLGTFEPLSDDAFGAEKLHSERIVIERPAGDAIRRAKAEGRRVVAVGTTTARALESFGAASEALDLLPFSRATDLFIKPGFTFRVVDALITNFHLPRSSLLLLVSAFAGRDAILEAYREAVTAGYRFYSYGDAMLID